MIFGWIHEKDLVVTLYTFSYLFEGKRIGACYILGIEP